jgi:membrane associated rhomboid family serine protease
VAVGEWWRVITYPLAHVSIYHLVLDATAFLSLYAALPFGRTRERLVSLLAVSLCSLGVAWVASPEIHVVGLGGLSGPAHGLLMIVALEIAASPSSGRHARFAAGVGVAGLVAKCLYEMSTGQLAGAEWHLGELGTPIVACHAGGAVGGLLAWMSWRSVQYRWRFNTNDQRPVPYRGRF